MSYAKGLAPVAVLGSSRFSLSRAASGQPRTVVPVAVVSIEVTWTAELAANGWLQPLTGSTLVDTKAMLSATVRASTDKDVLYAAPVSTDAGILYYRKDLVPNPPKTWDEIPKEAITYQEEQGRTAFEDGKLLFLRVAVHVQPGQVRRLVQGQGHVRDSRAAWPIGSWRLVARRPQRSDQRVLRTQGPGG